MKTVMTKNKVLLIFVASVFIFILAIYSISFPTFQTSKLVLQISSKSKISQLQNCISYTSNLEISPENFVQFYRQCVNSIIPKVQNDTFFMGRFFEYKTFLPLKSTFDRESCKWLTIGIGGTSNAEKEFKAKYPDCLIYGIEPSSDQYENFTQCGTVIPFGVGAKSGSFNLTIREGTAYIVREMPVLALSNILDKFIGTRFIPYMTIDIEGFEYNMMQEFLHGGIFYQEGIVFCQIDAELHGLNKTRTSIILNAFNSEKSDYFPAFTRPFYQHEKVTWINMVDKRCQNFIDLEPFLCAQQ